MKFYTVHQSIIEQLLKSSLINRHERTFPSLIWAIEYHRFLHAPINPVSTILSGPTFRDVNHVGKLSPFNTGTPSPIIMSDHVHIALFNQMPYLRFPASIRLAFEVI